MRQVFMRLWKLPGQAGAKVGDGRVSQFSKTSLAFIISPHTPGAAAVGAVAVISWAQGITSASIILVPSSGLSAGDGEWDRAQT